MFYTEIFDKIPGIRISGVSESYSFKDKVLVRISLVRGKSGSTGVLEYWSTGVLEYWSTGVLEYWSTGVLEYWSTEHPVT